MKISRSRKLPCFALRALLFPLPIQSIIHVAVRYEFDLRLFPVRDPSTSIGTYLPYMGLALILVLPFHLKHLKQPSRTRSVVGLARDLPCLPD